MIMEQETKLEVSKKWEKLGFTKEILGDHWIEIVNLMENQVLYAVMKPKKDKIENLTIPIISRIFSKNNILDIINFNTMLNPIIKTDENLEISAKTRFFKTKTIFPVMSAKDAGNVKGIINFLSSDKEFVYDELSICKVLSKSISNEIVNEILSDVYNNTGTVIDHKWKNKNYLKDIYLMLYQGIKNKSNEFPNWIITNKFLAEDLTEAFSGEISETTDQYLNKYSTIKIEDNKVAIYTNNLFASSILSGIKQKNKGYYYYPYILLSESEDRIVTRYAKRLTLNGSSCFGKINIINYNETGD